MTADLKPYPSYKPSGIEWLGDVPTHWEVRRVKHAFRRIVGGSTPSSSEMAYWDGTIVWVTPTDISKVTRLRDSLRRITKKGFDSCSATFVPVGSVVVTSRAPVGNVALAEVPLCTNQGCKTLVPDSQVIDSAYGYQVFGILKDELQSLANGTTFTEISTNALGNVLLPIPPLPEQAAIVRYLDHTDGRIRRYLHSRERLIELLKEYRQAVIHEAVTQGLDPDVPLKPSGVEWLGEVPAHWEVRRLKFSVENVADQTHKRRADEIYLAMEHVESWTGKYSEAGPDVVFDSSVKRFRAGDVLFGKLRPYLAKVTRPNRPGVCVGEFLVLRPRACAMSPGYLEQLMRSKLVIDAINASTFGAKMPRADWQFIGGMVQPVPPLAEQAAIAAYLDKQTAAVDAAMARAQREIELLSEYRTRLIADVVTGQVDVREAVTRLSDGCDIEHEGRMNPPL